ncbi:hypothetical protein CLOM_g20282 [Closterium sp. NIES-68]|nr:hypothetical protein CLOM_g20282 [Closterium sp. NIES-68]GJP64375.1 hypothetical protein CLOP_g21377 [Closterium sp. NIES-67]
MADLPPRAPLPRAPLPRAVLPLVLLLLPLLASLSLSAAATAAKPRHTGAGSAAFPLEKGNKEKYPLKFHWPSGKGSRSFLPGLLPGKGKGGGKGKSGSTGGSSNGSRGGSSAGDTMGAAANGGMGMGGSSRFGGGDLGGGSMGGSGGGSNGISGGGSGSGSGGNTGGGGNASSGGGGVAESNLTAEQQAALAKVNAVLGFLEKRKFTGSAMGIDFSGLTETLTTTLTSNNITIFAPTNGAFFRMPKSVRFGGLRRKPTVLKQVMAYHVLPRRLEFSDLKALGNGYLFQTLNGMPLRKNQTNCLRIARLGDSLGVRVVLGDMYTSPSIVVHGVDAVLLPSGKGFLASLA